MFLKSRSKLRAQGAPVQHRGLSMAAAPMQSMARNSCLSELEEEEDISMDCLMGVDDDYGAENFRAGSVADIFDSAVEKPEMKQ